MSDDRIWLMQYLCPARHALCAAPYRPHEATAAQIEATVHVLLTQRGINPWCGLCGSRDLRFEHRPTRYTTWQELLPALQAEEAKQALTRALCGNRQTPAAQEETL
jgi:hypothetical protein